MISQHREDHGLVGSKAGTGDRPWLRREEPHDSKIHHPWGRSAQEAPHARRQAIRWSQQERRLVLVGMTGIDQYHPGHFRGEARGVDPRVLPADRGTDEEERRVLARCAEQFVKVIRDARAGANCSRGIAPAYSGAVVPAGACEPGHFGLHRQPGIAGSVPAAFEDDGW